MAYFDMGDNWDVAKDFLGLDREGMFDTFNRPVLDDAISQGMDFKFNNNPRGPGSSSLLDEYNYIAQHPDYFWDGADMTFRYLPDKD